MARALWGLILAAVVFVGLVPGSSHAVTASWQIAYQNCQNDVASRNWSSLGGNAKCFLRSDFPEYKISYGNGSTSTFCLNYDCGFNGPRPTEQTFCQAMPAKTGILMAATNVCVAGCNYSPSDDGGRVFTVKGIDGSMRTAGGGTYTPTGGSCNGGPFAAAPVTDPLPPRKLCGGGSCHDVAAGQFCAVNGVGVQVCVADKPPAGSPGGCVTSGDTTLCAGNPPPLPPNPPIADPASQIAASDKYTDAGAAGTTTNISTVNNYNQEGAAPNSGAGADDNKPPASSSSAPSPGDPTRAGGGGDCNSPPMCEGAAATCMVVTQTYLLRCPPGGEGTSNDSDTTVPGLDGIGEAPGEGLFKSETVLDKLDTGGFGGGTQCPRFPAIVIPMFNIDYQDSPPGWCDLLAAAGNVIMLLAAFISLRVLSEK
jgi:hypothetical protein